MGWQSFGIVFLVTQELTTEIMRSITLKFQDPKDLVEFIELTKTACEGLDHRALIITCYLSEAHIELAREGYRALVLDSSMN